MKNTEWGAVAYLSISNYGINKEININNNTNRITGFSAVVSTNQTDYPGTYGYDSNVTLPYNTETGYQASTTGNISGIYDMNGGSHEYVAAYKSGRLKNSGFDTFPEITFGNKYLDLYPTNSSYTSYNNRILGDATGELGPFHSYQDGDGNYRTHNSWWSDYSYFTDSDVPWIARGGTCSNGIISGQLATHRDTGEAYITITFRIVLSN
jgi:hypothetical protein